MIYHREDQIIKNNEVQQEIPQELLKEFFDRGIDLWHFIDDYEVVDTEEEGFDELKEGEEYEEPLFPMTCVGHSQGDNWEDVYEGKKYYAQTSYFLDDMVGGDGVEYELWQHRVTKDIYRVNIEINRDWDKATKQ